MYSMVFNSETIKDLYQHQSDGRQIFAAVTMPVSGTFTNKATGASVNVPKIICPYQINDIFAIQEKWARSETDYVLRSPYDFQKTIELNIENQFVDFSTGKIVSNAVLGIRSDYIDLSGCSTLVCSDLSGRSAGYVDSVYGWHTIGVVAFYDDDKNYLSSISRSSTNFPNSVTIDLTSSTYRDAKYAIISSRDISDSGYDEWGHYHDGQHISNTLTGLDYGQSSSFTFRPASTMPVEAANLYGRIVSIRSCRITQEIIDHYLTIGETSDSCAGVGKIIGTTDRGNRILSNLRNSKNRKALTKFYQPSISSAANKVTSLRYYRLHQSVQYEGHFQTDSAWLPSHSGYTTLKSSSTGYAISRAVDLPYHRYMDPETGIIKFRNDCILGKETDTVDNRRTIDANLGRWYTRGSNVPPNENTDKQLLYLGESRWSNPKYQYLVLDSSGHPSPVLATYPVEIIDPDKHLFAWLISAYLCDKDGNILGDQF